MSDSTINIHLHFPEFNALSAKLDSVLTALNQLTQQGTVIMADLTQITADVAADTTVTQSAVTLIQGLAAAITAAGTDPAALAALSSQLQQNATALAAAITANTPAAPAGGAPASASVRR